MTVIQQAGSAAFSPRARLLRLIGSELISDEVVAISELVKNAHDADASVVTIQFTGVTSPDGEIHIRDDGTGMDLNTLLTRWMQPASSAKGRIGGKFTPLGRRMLGEKGVGRFAVDKLAAHLHLVSRTSSNDSELHARFDWDDFENDDRMLSDLRAHWEIKPPDLLDSSGTLLRLRRLRSRWNERLFRRLSSRLSRLVSPFDGESGFRIVIESDEFPHYAGELTGRFLDEAPYRIDAEFDGLRTLTFSLRGAKRSSVRVGVDGPLTCGPFRVRLYGFDLETESLARVGPRVDVRAWLREWSGISVYRDGFRVWPYGEPHDDWLRLDQRRVNNPVVRLSNNQVVGFVEISGDRNPSLRDQTNREGLIRNEGLDDLQAVIGQALQLLEADRQSLRHPSVDPRKSRSAVPGEQLTLIADSMSRLAGHLDGEPARELVKLAERARQEVKTSDLLGRRMLSGYASLAALGHSASLLGRSVILRVGEGRSKLQQVRERLRNPATLDRASLESLLAEVDEALGQPHDYLQPLVRTRQSGGERRRGLDLVSELQTLESVMQPVLAESAASWSMEVEPGPLPRVEMRPEVLSSLLGILIRNSLDWPRPGVPVAISIKVSTDDDKVEILFSDRGQGVPRELETTLFQPGVTGREGAAGMGLTLAQGIVTSHGGEIVLLRDHLRYGARFRITLPRKRTRATLITPPV